MLSVNISRVKLLLLFSLTLTCKVKAQDSTVRNKIMYEIDRNVNIIPVAAYNDSCFYHQVLLKIDFDNRSIITGISFSDNASDWLQTELAKGRQRINNHAIEKDAKKAGYKNVSMIIPVVIRPVSFPYLCKRNLIINYDKHSFSFKNKPLAGKIFFGEAIIVEYFLNGRN